jgi:hypothetical protein
MQRRLPWKEIWDKQAIPKNLVQPLKTILAAAYRVIVHPPGGRNITEWCKRPECWSTVLELDLKLALPTPSEQDDSSETEGATPLTTVERAVVDVVKRVHPEIWLNLAAWAKSTQSLTVIQRKVAVALGKQALTGKLNRKLAKDGGPLLLRAVNLGWVHPKLSKELTAQLQSTTEN